MYYRHIYNFECGGLADPESGAVSVSGTTYNSVATYTCDSQLTLGRENTQ